MGISQKKLFIAMRCGDGAGQVPTESTGQNIIREVLVNQGVWTLFGMLTGDREEQEMTGNVARRGDASWFGWMERDGG